MTYNLRQKSEDICLMKIKIFDEEPELTAVSYVNGVLICVDENLEDYYDDGNSGSKGDAPKKRLKKDPEDNLGGAVAFLDTDGIERGVDFEEIKTHIDGILKANGWSMSDLFRNDDVIAGFCKHYDYSLQGFVRLMSEHMPETMNLNFLRSTVRPVVVALQKMKNEFDNGTDGERRYKKIFAYM